MRLVHPRISAHVAARLGAPSLRRLLLAASADSMALGPVGGAAEAFGQSEALTTRLRHIIADYPEGPGGSLGAGERGMTGTWGTCVGHCCGQVERQG